MGVQAERSSMRRSVRAAGPLGLKSDSRRVGSLNDVLVLMVMVLVEMVMVLVVVVVMVVVCSE